MCVCECWYGSLDPLKVHGADLHPMTRRDEGHFPLPCVLPPSPLRQRWRRSSLISPEPTGLFFHLRIPPSLAAEEEAPFIFSASLSPSLPFNQFTFCPCIFVSAPPFISLHPHSRVMKSFRAPPCLGLCCLPGAHRCQLVLTVRLR